MKLTSHKVQLLARVTPLFIFALALALFVGMLQLDLARYRPGAELLEVVLKANPATSRYVLTAIAGTLATVVAITITLVLIVVQLTANRYTHRLTELFIEAKVNLALLSLFLFSIIYALYVAHTIKDDFAPSTGILVCLGLMTACLVVVVPYLYYVLDFLEPTNIIRQIERRATACLRQCRRRPEELAAAKLRLSQSIEQIADLAKDSLRRADTSVALASVAALVELALEYLAQKEKQPPAWWEVEPELFPGASSEYLARIQEQSIWVEVRALRELQVIYQAALGESSEVYTAVALGCRRVGEAALAAGDDALLNLIVKFFNTFLREGINAGEPRALYNVLRQYRLLAEALLTEWPALAVQISQYFHYYAREASRQKLPFVAETVAYDLKVLNQRAGRADFPRQKDLLAVFLSLPECFEGSPSQPPLAGIYKMFLVLACFYRQQGAEALAERLVEAFRPLEPAVVQALGQELLSVTQAEFWEVTDRGVNFDYMEPALRAHLPALLEELAGK